MPTPSRGFPPIAAPDARVLVLGSLPGQASLAARQYYAQPRNAFWRIMGELVGAGLDVPYDERVTRLRASGIALWDVCEAAERPGSLDAAIDLQSVVTNDFACFFQQHPRVVHVCANGATAHRLYLRRVRPLLPEPWSTLPLHLLPSSSPAHASLNLAQKLARWRVLDELRASRP
jgi:double-stranded uracil-DNA glycosylase